MNKNDKALSNKPLYKKKNKSVTITISHTAMNKLNHLADGYPIPTLMRMILEASAEHRGNIYSLLAKLSTNKTNTNNSF
jgi:predicted DNA binding CopG/RHH family protein